MLRIKIADLNHNSELKVLSDRETTKITGGSDLSDSVYNLSGASGSGEQKIAIVTQSLFNINEQFGFVGNSFSGNINSNENFQSNSATAD